jgi:hypothetical protein
MVLISADALRNELERLLSGETAYITADDYKRITEEDLDEFSTAGRKMIAEIAAVASSSAAARCSALDFDPNFTPMEYLGIRYTIRARTERGQWHVAIYPAGVEMNGRVVIGSRRDAELRARAMIDSWLKRRATQKLESN